MTCKWIAETIGIRYKMKSLLSLPFNFRMQKALTLLRTACYSNTRSNPFVIFSISIGMCSSGYSDLTHSTWIVEACVPMTVGIFSAFGLMCPIEMCKLMACGNSTLAIPPSLPFPWDYSYCDKHCLHFLICLLWLLRLFFACWCSQL